MSSCEEVRELLWPLDEPRAAVEGEAEARAHVEACPECRAFFRRDAALSSALRSIRYEARVPDPLRTRLAEALSAETVAHPPAPRVRSGRFSRTAPLLAAAAALVLAAIGLLQLTTRDLDALYVESYLSRDSEELVLDTSDADQAYEFFMRELGLPLTPVAVGEGRVSRAMICRVEGRQMAVVEYELRGHEVAHYRGPVRAEDGGGAMHSATEDGVCVVRWSDGQFDHALVADIPEDELRLIATQHFAALR